MEIKQIRKWKVKEQQEKQRKNIHIDWKKKYSCGTIET